MNSALRAIGCKLAKAENLSDTDFYAFLEEVDCSRRGAAQIAQTSSARAAPSFSDGGMRLARRDAEVRFSEDRCQPASFVLLEGGQVDIIVQSGPPQSFLIGRDVEDVSTTPLIPAGDSYTWKPLEAGHYVISSEVYPYLKSAAQVVDAADAAAAAASPRLGAQPGGSAGVEDCISFPLLGSRQVLAAAGTARPDIRSQGTQTSSRHTSSAFGAGPGNPAPVLCRFALPASPRPGSGSSGEGPATSTPDGFLDSPPGVGLRRRAGRSAAPAGAAPPPIATMPPPGRSLPDGICSLSSGSTGSPRSGSGSGSELSGASAPLYVQRRLPGGMLSTTRAYSVARSGSAGYPDSRSSAEELQPLLYSVGPHRPPHLQPSSYGGSYSVSRQAPAGAAAPAEPRPPTFVKCPRCRKQYVSTVNQRRCISSHLGASGPRGAAQAGAAGSKQLAEFWDGLGEAEKAAVLDLSGEPNSEFILRQLEVQLLHRKREGQLDGLSTEQRRLHTAGKMLHQFCTGPAGPGGGAAFSGSNLVSVLSQVSEGTFLCASNTTNRDELVAGDNLEAGLGALVTKRLVEAQLRAKARDAERVQRELEDLEAAQAAAPPRGRQQAGVGAQQAQPAGKKKSKAKGKGKAAPTRKTEPAAAASAASAASSDAEAGEDAAAQPQQQQQREQQQQEEQEEGRSLPSAQPAASDAAPSSSGLSLPSDGRYGSSPDRAQEATSSFTNFLFSADGGEAEAEADAEPADGWTRAGGSRPASRASRAHDPPPKRSSSLQALAGAAAKPQNGAAKGARVGSSTGSGAAAVVRPGGLAAAERSSSVGAASRAPLAAAAAGPPVRPQPAAQAVSSRMASGARAPAVGDGQARPQQEAFPSLPAVPAGPKPAPAAAPSSTRPSGVSYAAAAAKVQQAMAPAPAPAGAPPAQKPRQQPQQAGPAASSVAKQPAPRPLAPSQAGPAAGGGQDAAAALAAADPVDGLAAAAPPAAPADLPAAAAPPQQPQVAPQSAAHAGAVPPASEPAALEPAAAAAAPPPASAAAEAAGDAARAPAAPQSEEPPPQDIPRAASVTPPISDSGSPPPCATLAPPPGAYPMPPHGWVGADGSGAHPEGCMPPPPPMGFYWHVMPPPGVQFGSMDMGEVVPPAAAPYPPFHPAYFHPGPYSLPPGMMLPPPYGMPPYGEAQLPPFPPGMPRPLPPEAAEQLAAAAAAEARAAGEQEGQQDGQPQPQPQEAPAASKSTPEEGRVPAAAALEDSAGPPPLPAPAEAQAAAPQRQAAAEKPRRSFLDMLEAACGAPPAAAAVPGPRRRRGPAFSAAAAAAEFERRWQAAAPALARLGASQAGVSTGGKQPGGPVASVKAAATARGSKGASSPGSLAGPKGALAHRAASGSAGGSGRASPAGGGVVVAVRAWSSSDDGSGEGRWRIQTAAQQQ